eukprot:scaffold180396_cov37-Prasinocladus_malaysianus.AAC.1
MFVHIYVVNITGKEAVIAGCLIIKAYSYDFVPSPTSRTYIKMIRPSNKYICDGPRVSVSRIKHECDLHTHKTRLIICRKETTMLCNTCNKVTPPFWSKRSSQVAEVLGPN